MPEDRNRALAGLGASAFERNDLTAAEHYATQAFELAQQRSDEELKVRAGLILARVQQARGQTAQALDRLHLLAAQTQRMPLLREVPAWQTRFSLANGDLAAAQHWASAYAPGQAAPSILLQELEALTLARIQIATGQPAAALKALEAWQLDAHRQGRTRSELEILCLNALAHSAQAETEQAQKALVRALTLAQPKGCQRVFLDEGEALMLLLQTLLPDLKKRRLITFATLLLRAFASTRSTPPASAALAASPLLEPLSVQEQRVLRLLAAGLSNPEIARELVVSVNTIKTQVKSIYRKLNVSNREEACETARQSKLG